MRQTCFDRPFRTLALSLAASFALAACGGGGGACGTIRG